MKLSELIAHGERLVDTARDFHRGAGAVADAAPKVAQNVADEVTKLGRHIAKLRADYTKLYKQYVEANQALDAMRIGNGRLNTLAAELRTQATKDRSEIASLKGKLQDAERRIEAHRETIRGYFKTLDAEAARQGNPNGKATPASTDGQ